MCTCVAIHKMQPCTWPCTPWAASLLGEVRQWEKAEWADDEMQPPSPDRSGTRPLIVLDVTRMTSQDAAHRSITRSSPIYHPAPGESPVTTLAYRFAVNSGAPNGPPRCWSPDTGILRPTSLAGVICCFFRLLRATSKVQYVEFGLICFFF